MTKVRDDLKEKGALLPGDLIVGVGSERGSDLSDFRLLLDMQERSNSKSIVLFRLRGETLEFVTVDIKRG